MRRMMHATLVVLLMASAARAQSDIRPDHAAPNAAKSLLTEFVPDCSDRPFSQLAMYMNCSDCSSNLWNHYSSQRAALAAHHSKHTDGRCGCSAQKNCLHRQATSPCGSQVCRTEGHTERNVPLNRYVVSTTPSPTGIAAPKFGSDPQLGSDKGRMTFSTLHIAPSPSSGTSVTK